MAPPPVKPFQLLEINIISAQDLEPVSRKMRTYATAWIHPKRKLSSRVDADGNANPTWNDKFVFRVDDEFLRQDTSAVMIEIYAEHRFRDKIVGTVGVLVGNLIPPPVRSQQKGSQRSGMRFVALQVRRPSGRPQGILNIGVSLLDSSMRSMPLYTQLSASAVGFHDLMDDPSSLLLPQKKGDKNNNDSNNNQTTNAKPILSRSKSERSMTYEKFSPNSSIIAIAGKMGDRGSSILSITEPKDPFKGMIKKKGKASSVINGAEFRKKPKHKGKKSKGSSVVSDSIYSKHSSSFHKIEKPDSINRELKTEEKNLMAAEKLVLVEPTKNKLVDKKSVTKAKGVKKVDPYGKIISKNHGYDYGAPKGSLPKHVIGAPKKGGSIICSDSEVGPSPSEVAAVMAEKRYPLDDNKSSVLDGWSVDESVEGLRSKLERWRTELPPLYDRGFSSSSYRSSGSHARRRSDSGPGLFSCFGNICGCECQCVCGKPTARSHSTRFHSPSTGTSFF